MVYTSPLSPWFDRIKKILHVDDATTNYVAWLLVPMHGDEVTDEEAKLLFKNIRSYLFNDRLHPDIATIRYKLHTISHDERLVLLYALRYIALKGAGQNRYWPLCHKLLFDEKIELQTLQVSLAPELTDQWLAFYRYTQGRLFFPQHGKRNIKWPLAHAGLLIRDKELLQHFRQDLARSWRKDEFQLLLQPDSIDDFALELEEWLKFNNSHESFALAIKNDERGLTLLELAQHYLSSIQHSHPDTDALLQSVSLKRQTRTIVYNSYTQHIELHIRLSFATSQGDLFVEWQQKRRRCSMDATHTRYDVVLPLDEDHWPEYADFKGEYRTEHIRLPKSIGSASVVFDANTGQRARTWRFGEEYYLLLPAKQSIDSDLQHLFVSYESAPPLSGNWHNHSLWYVKVVTPDGNNPLSLSELNELADRFGLPLFASGEVHAHLVGGLLLHHDPPRYAVDEQPSLHISGVWEKEIQIEHQIWDADQVMVLETTMITVAPQTVPESHVWNYTPINTPSTWHTVLLNGRVVVQWGTVAHQHAPAESGLSATLSVYVDADLPLTRISTQDLKLSTVAITAWPYAEVHLCAYDQKNTRISQALRLDETGMLTIAFKETVLAQMVDQACTMYISWRGMPISEGVICYTPRAIPPDDIVIEHHDNSLHVMTHIGHLSVSTRMLLVAVGVRPWDGQIWQTTVSVNRDGWVDKIINVTSSDVAWILFFQHRSGQQPVFHSFYGLGNQHSLVPTGYDNQTGPTRGPWYALIKMLEGHDLPHRMQQLIHRAHFDQFWHEVQHVYLVACSWRELHTHPLIDMVKLFQDAGIHIPQALCEWIPDTESRNPQATVLAIHNLALFKETLHQVNRPVPLEIRYATDNARRIDASVQWELDDGDYKLRLCTPENISICPQCRLVLNHHTDHAHWTQPNRQCTSGMRQSTKHQRVRVAVLLDIWNILHSFIKSLSAALYGRTISYLWQQWIEDLHPYFEQSGQTDQRAWLEGFQRACLIILTMEGTQLNASDRALVVRYQGALRMMLRQAKAVIDVDTA